MGNIEKDWKLKLRYGKLQTPYKHYTLIGEGFAEKFIEDFACPPGSAFMGIKVWASSHEEAANLIQSVAQDIGFSITGDIEIYDSDPEEPPTGNPYGYEIKFTPFQKD
jgi:hypothetical protein